MLATLYRRFTTAIPPEFSGNGKGTSFVEVTHYRFGDADYFTLKSPRLLSVQPVRYEPDSPEPFTFYEEEGDGPWATDFTVRLSLAEVAETDPWLIWLVDEVLSPVMTS